MANEYHPVLHLGEPKDVESPVSGLHVFNPDHNLYCEDCGYGEMQGEHGIIALEQGRQVYESPEVAEMYADAFELTGNGFYEA